MSLLLFSMVLATNGQVLTLDDALHTATALQPQLRQARANVDVAKARADEALSPLLPQVSGTASYQRTTANFVLRPGALPMTVNGTPVTNATSSSGATFNYFNFQLTASQTLFDFPTFERWRSTRATTEAQAFTTDNVLLTVEQTVRSTFFNARAQKALVQVAVETMQNQDRHLQQIAGFVKVGTRPEIDLAQARTDLANARVQKINAENNYRIAKAQLNQAMGVEGSIDYDVADETLPPVAGENRSTDQMLTEALLARPDLLSLEKQIRAQELLIRSAQGGYAPTLGFTTSLNDAGSDITRLGWNWNGVFSANWNLFQGLLTWSQVREQKATLVTIIAQRDLLRQQVHLDVEQARVAVEGAIAALAAADEALVNAKERLRLAEGRYQAGVGSVIELGDAQVALTNAAAQRVSSEYTLANARAQLLKALGRH